MLSKNEDQLSLSKPPPKLHQSIRATADHYLLLLGRELRGWGHPQGRNTSTLQPSGSLHDLTYAMELYTEAFNTGCGCIDQYTYSHDDSRYLSWLDSGY